MTGSAKPIKRPLGPIMGFAALYPSYVRSEEFMPDKKLTGRIAAERIRMQSTPKPPAGAVERFLALGECTSLISDVMDELGVPEGVIGATVLKPTLPGKLIVGPALTVRNIRQRSDPLAAKTHVNRMAEFEAHNLAEDGDVLVISGVAGMSNMGGISSYTGQRQGERGAIVMGGVRDVRHSRSIGYPVWASEITPATGKWRLETVEINGEIQMGEVRVNPGDLVVADDTGVCFIPRADILRVLELCEKKKKERRGRAHRGDHPGRAGAGFLRQRLNSAAGSQ
jgi:4-hydroxy-4-methyl-2-oxoglutarate aldolase